MLTNDQNCENEKTKRVFINLKLGFIFICPVWHITIELLEYVAGNAQFWHRLIKEREGLRQ